MKMIKEILINVLSSGDDEQQREMKTIYRFYFINDFQDHVI